MSTPIRRIPRDVPAGGLLAIELAARGEARTACALSPAGFANRAEILPALAGLWLGVRAARPLSSRAPALPAPQWRRKLALGLFVAHPERMSLDAAVGDLRGLAGAPWFDATLPTLTPFSAAGPSAITVPVTIAWGDRDRLLPPRQAARALREIPGARLVTLKDCGHVPMSDDPIQVAQVLLAAAAGGGDQAPVATGRAGSAIHSLQEPA